jgi:hypothetical protein
MISLEVPCECVRLKCLGIHLRIVSTKVILTQLKAVCFIVSLVTGI